MNGTYMIKYKDFDELFYIDNEYDWEMNRWNI